MTHAEHHAHKAIEHYKRLLEGSLSPKERLTAEARLHNARVLLVQAVFARCQAQEVADEVVAA